MFEPRSQRRRTVRAHSTREDQALPEGPDNRRSALPDGACRRYSARALCLFATVAYRHFGDARHGVVNADFRSPQFERGRSVESCRRAGKVARLRARIMRTNEGLKRT
jgi:hypothetical protein